MRAPTWILVLSFLMTAARLASAGEYLDPSGFAFRYPEGWIAVNEQGRATLAKEVREWFDNQAFDLQALSVLVVDPTSQEFAPNCNVVVNSSEIPVTERTLEELRGALPGQYKSMGIEISRLRADIQEVGANRAIVLHYDTKLPGVPHDLHQQQVYVPGGGRTHIITCTTTIDRVAQDDMAFQSILASFRVPPVEGGRFDWKAIGSSSMTGGIVGGLTAGIVAGPQRGC